METVLQSLREKADLLNNAVEILPAATSQCPNEEYETLVKTSLAIGDTMKHQRAELSRSRDLLRQFQELREMFEARNKEIARLQTSIPECVLATTEPAAAAEGDRPSSASPKPRKKRNPADSKPQAASGRKKNSIAVPTIPHALAEEFQAVPKYMKGKINYSEVNSAIDQLNRTVAEKYKIVNKSRGVSDFERVKKITWKEQEDKNTHGEIFITESDIEEFCSRKCDKHFMSVLTIVRHIGRVKHHRHGKLTKYLIRAG